MKNLWKKFYNFFWNFWEWFFWLEPEPWESELLKTASHCPDCSPRRSTPCRLPQLGCFDFPPVPELPRCLSPSAPTTARVGSTTGTTPQSTGSCSGSVVTRASSAPCRPAGSTSAGTLSCSWLSAPTCFLKNIFDLH